MLLQESRHQNGALSLCYSRNLMMASSKQAITHHLVALFFSCLKNQENQPIIYPHAAPCTHAHTHIQTPGDMYTCQMHLRTYIDVHNFTRTTLHLRRALSSWPPAGVWCHYSSLRPPISQCSVITRDILAQCIDYPIIQSLACYWSFIERPPDNKAVATDCGSIGTQGEESPCS